MLAFLLLAFAAISSSFEGGALRSYDWTAPDHLVATVPGQADQSGRNHQPSWYYFSISGVKGKTLTIDIAGLEGEYNFVRHNGRGLRNMRPAFSYDNLHWHHFESAEWLENPSRIRVRFTPQEDTVWIARIPPYTLGHLQALLDSIQPHRHLVVTEMGRSVENRPLHLLTITDPNVPLESKKTIWIMSRQHSWEAGSSWVMEGAVRFLLSIDPAARELRSRYVFQMMPMLDPDGVAAGGVRFNRNGFDLNRNWDADDPVKMPEIAAAKKTMQDWLAQGRKIDFFVTIHNEESADHITGPLSSGRPEIRELIQRLNDALEASTHFHSVSGPRDQRSFAQEPGRMTVDTWVFQQTKGPAMLMELMTDPNPKLGRPPFTQDRLNFGAALVRLIDHAIVNPKPNPHSPSTPMVERNTSYANTLESYLRDDIVDGYAARAASRWKRDYSSVDAYLKSVEANRQRYRAMLAPPDLKAEGPLRRVPFTAIPGLRAEWVTLPLTGGLMAEGLLAMPANATGKVPLVIAQHGIGSYPEKTFGLEDPTGGYKAYSKAMVERGFAVLAPMNLFTIERRNRVERLARLDGTTLAGIEFQRIKLLLDAVLTDPAIDADRVGFWGISLGGMAGMYWTPLEPRIKASIITAWFNHRRNKMAVPDQRYSVFLDTTEEYSFLRGWLTEFTDSDVASLICPRPLMVQHGKQDRIAHWPQVQEEFDAAREHYKKLGIEDRAELVMFEGGHEIELPTGLDFLTRWLKP
jgi:murein tripeptide amidase MpaA/dienelactone hydrolase